MTDKPTSVSAAAGGARAGARSRDMILDAVSHRHRRYVLDLLRERERPLHREDLAERIVARERDTSPGPVTGEESRDILTSLQHTHLPKLEAVGLIERDSGDGVAAVDRSAVDSLDLDGVAEAGDGLPEGRLDRILDVLSEPTRRTLLSALDGLPREEFPISIEQAADAIIEHEESTSPGGIPGDEYERLVVSLHHRHLPKLHEAGVITYDRDGMEISYPGRRPEADGEEPGTDGAGSGTDGAGSDEFVAIDRLRTILE